MPRPPIPDGYITFDPQLVPSNPLMGMPYPLEFKTVANTGFNFKLRGRGASLFEVEHNQAACIAIYRQLFDAFIPQEHMVALSALKETLDSIARSFPDTLYAREYEDVDREYNEVRNSAGLGMNVDDNPDLYDLSFGGMNMDDLLDLIRQSPCRPDIHCQASIGTQEDPNRPLLRVILLLAAIKQAIPEDYDGLKTRFWMIASLCQALGNLAYGNEMFGSTFGFLAFGMFFRRALIVHGDLYVDIGPVKDGQVGSVVQDMSLYDLILYGTREDQQPTDYGQQLRPDSTPTDGAAGYAFVGFLQAMGQSWLCEASGRKEDSPTFDDMGLGGTFARVVGFSLDLLGRTVGKVYRHCRVQQEENARLLQQQQHQQQHQQQPGPTHNKDRLELANADADTGDPMKMHVYRKAEKGQAISSLQDSRNDLPGPSEQNKADLKALARGAADVDIDKLFAELDL